MPLIPVISEPAAEGAIKDLYEKYRAPWGGVDNILKIHSLLPDTLTPHVDLYRTLMFGRGPLSRVRREMIATVVSKSNECTYCIHHHGDGLYRLTKNRVLTDAVRTDFRRAEIPEADRAMLEFAAELTAHPTSDFSSLVESLKENGFSNEAILHMTLIISYFNFVNRIANGLRVDLEHYWQADGYSDPGKPMAHDPR